MNIKKFKFPEPNVCLPTDPDLLEEAKKRGFYNGNTKYNTLFSKLFFQGGKILLKKELDQDFKNRALPYLKAFAGSFEPKHEEKDAIAALILSELVEGL